MSVRLFVCACLSQVGVLSKRMNESSWFWHGSFLPPILHCVNRKFGYLQIRTFRWIMDFEKFSFGISIVETCYQLSSRKVDAQSVVNWAVVGQLRPISRATCVARQSRQCDMACRATFSRLRNSAVLYSLRLCWQNTWIANYTAKQNQTTIYSKKRKQQRLANHDWVFCQQSRKE